MESGSGGRRIGDFTVIVMYVHVHYCSDTYHILCIHDNRLYSCAVQ